MRFPDFDHLHLYERTERARYDISRSNVVGYRFSEFRRELGSLDLDWTDTRGSPELRKMIGKTHGVPEDHVLATMGATEANFLVNAALVDRGDRVLVDSPMYSPLRDVPRGMGANVQEVRRSCTDGWTLDLDRWKAAAAPRARLFVLCNLNNPTSSLLDGSQLRELADLAADTGAYLLVDETFRDLAFDRTPPTAVSLGDHCIALSTLTKVYGLGGLRLGWIAAHPDLLAAMKGVKDYTTATPPGISDVIGRWALLRRESFLRRAKRILEGNRRRLTEAVEDLEELAGPWPSIGTVCFPHSRANVTKLEQRLLKTYDTVIAHGRYFGVPDHFRIGLGGNPVKLSRGLTHLRSALRDLA